MKERKKERKDDSDHDKPSQLCTILSSFWSEKTNFLVICPFYASHDRNLSISSFHLPSASNAFCSIFNLIFLRRSWKLEYIVPLVSSQSTYIPRVL
jgi:hypothetical protein